MLRCNLSVGSDLELREILINTNSIVLYVVYFSCKHLLLEEKWTVEMTVEVCPSDTVSFTDFPRVSARRGGGTGSLVRYLIRADAGDTMCRYIGRRSATTSIRDRAAGEVWPRACFPGLHLTRSRAPDRTNRAQMSHVLYLLVSQTCPICHGRFLFNWLIAQFGRISSGLPRFSGPWPRRCEFVRLVNVEADLKKLILCEQLQVVIESRKMHKNDGAHFIAGTVSCQVYKYKMQFSGVPGQFLP